MGVGEQVDAWAGGQWMDGWWASQASLVISQESNVHQGMLIHLRERGNSFSKPHPCDLVCNN